LSIPSSSTLENTRYEAGWEEGKFTIPILTSESPMTAWRRGKIEMLILILADTAVSQLVQMLLIQFQVN
jgi:hypothetical protein